MSNRQASPISSVIRRRSDAGRLKSYFFFHQMNADYIQVHICDGDGSQLRPWATLYEVKSYHETQNFPFISWLRVERLGNSYNKILDSAGKRAYLGIPIASRRRCCQKTKKMFSCCNPTTSIIFQEKFSPGNESIFFPPANHFVAYRCRPLPIFKSFTVNCILNNSSGENAWIGEARKICHLLVNVTAHRSAHCNEFKNKSWQKRIRPACLRLCACLCVCFVWSFEARVFMHICKFA